MVGFEDAYRAALAVRVRASPPLDILVASTPGLMIMKIISWADRPEARSRDAVDLVHILERYLDADNYGRLLEAHMDLAEVENFDYVRAGARLLGRDIASIGEPETRGRTADLQNRSALLVLVLARIPALSHSRERVWSFYTSGGAFPAPVPQQ